MSWGLYDPADIAKAMLDRVPGEFKIGLCSSEPHPKLDIFQKGMQRLTTKLEKLYMSNIKVGDRVEAPRHGRGKVLAIEGGDAWVQTEGKDYPLTFDVRKLKLVPKPRQGFLCVMTGPLDWWGGSATRSGVVEVDTPAVELTPEVRERLQDLL